MNLESDSIPGCIGLRKPISANNCITYRYAKLCQKVVAKERLQAILTKIEEAQKVLQGA